jgi:hypothetical protein
VAAVWVLLLKNPLGNVVDLMKKMRRNRELSVLIL